MPKSLAIFGAGQSAKAAERLAKRLELKCVLFDQEGHGDATEFTQEDVERFDGLVFSPGFAADHPWRRLAESSGLPCMSELGFAAKYWKGKIIGITGTNGKTTLTSLLAQALSGAGSVSVAAGNIGLPFSDAALSRSNLEGAYAVLEISSFQAELAEGIELDGLIWTNFAEDHLDRYSSMESYFAAKANLLLCLKPDAVCVFGPQLAPWLEGRGDLSKSCLGACGATSLLEKLTSDSVFQRFPYSENFSLAAEFWRMLGEESEHLVGAANAFTLSPHRLNIVAQREGVSFWDDSKATNFHATLAALKSVGQPIVWIGGGCAKGGDVESFAEAVSTRVEAAVIYGAVSVPLGEAIKKRVEQTYIVREFEEAVRVSADLSVSIPSSNVLLSPGFSSFDQFDSYAERGKSFTETVLSLKNVDKPS